MTLDRAQEILVEAGWRMHDDGRIWGLCVGSDSDHVDAKVTYAFEERELEALAVWMRAHAK